MTTKIEKETDHIQQMFSLDEEHTSLIIKNVSDRHI